MTVPLLASIYAEITGTIIHHKQSQKFAIRKGVRQAFTISPILLIACLEGMLTKLDLENFGFTDKREYLGHLRFADDIFLLSESVEQLKQMSDELH